MKQGWEIKKLKDISVLITDGDWIESRHQSDDGIRLIQTGNIGNGIFKAKDAKPHYISEETFKELGCTEIFSGDCLVSRLPEPVGRACIIPELDYRMITAVDCTIIRFNDFILPKFFVYYSQSSKYLRDINNSTTGTTRKRISRKNLESVTIPIPSISEQEKIVAELDCLSGIIEKKKQQLKEYDALAQSIFYEMFGNPIDNEKGWEVKMWNEVFETQTGKLNANAMVENGKYPFFTCSKEAYQIDYYAFDCEALLLAGNNATANYDVKYYNGKFNAYQRTYVLTLKSKGLYLFYKFSLENKLSLLQEQSIGGMTKYLTIGILSKISFICPPLALQQKFASKIEAIEKQKELIKQSIAETEILFNSRMDYYFN